MTDPLTGILRRLTQLEDYILRKKAFPIQQYIENTWVPVFTGFLVDPAGGIYRYKLIGNLCVASVCMPNAGTSNATGFTMTAPVMAKTVAGMIWFVVAAVQDNGVVSATPGLAYIASASNIIILSKNTTAVPATWTNANGKAADFTLVYEI